LRESKRSGLLLASSRGCDKLSVGAAQEAKISLLGSVVAHVFWLLFDGFDVLKQSALETEVEVLLLRQQLRLLERKHPR